MQPDEKTLRHLEELERKNWHHYHFLTEHKTDLPFAEEEAGFRLTLGRSGTLLLSAAAITALLVTIKVATDILLV